MKRTILIVLLSLSISTSLATGRTIYVDDDGPADFNNIQAAIDDANDGDTVVVKPGTYTGEGNHDIDFKGRAVTVRSTDPNDSNTIRATVIDCNGMGRGFIFHSGEDVNSVLDGFTITNGYAWAGGAIHCSSSSPKITNCIISGNTAWGWDEGGGGIYSQESRAVIKGCTVVNNTTSGYGGAIFDNRSQHVVAHCLISANKAGRNGGGIYFMQVGRSMDSSSTIANCIITGNTARNNGGGIYNYNNVSLTLTNCTFSHNSAADDGGGIYNNYYNCRPTLANCIVWANLDSTGTGLLAQIRGEPREVSFSCIQDDDPDDENVPFGGADSNNIDDDPMFVREPNDGGDGWGDDPTTSDVNEAANDDFGDVHLQVSSPCINTGASFLAFDIQVDIDGQPRIMGGQVDMGADELNIEMIVVTKPQGDEIWISGSMHEVAWYSHLYDGAVDISFSKDAGENWKAIESNISDTGSYLWHLPDIVDSNQCLIKIIPHIPDSNVVCVDSGLFTIHPDSPDPAVESKWESLGGGPKRAGLSKIYGPEYGCVKWKFQPDGPIPTSVTISVDNRVHIACEDGKLYTLNPNGSLLWSYDVNSPLISSPTIGPDGTVYVGSQNGKLYAIDINGNLRWTHTTAGPVSSSPAVSADGNIYVGSQDGLLYALAPDGSELWSFRTKGPGFLPDGSIFASPSIGADGSVYIAGLYDPNLYALDPNDGVLKWTCNFESGGWPFASPVIAQDGTIYQALLYDSNLYAIEPNDGSITWSTNLDIYCDFVEEYVALHGELPPLELIEQNCEYWFGLQPPAGLEGYIMYTQYKDADGWSEPALGPDGTIYVGFDDPYLRAVDPNGTIKWVTPLGTLGGFTLTIGNDGLIYAAGDDGMLHVVDANGWEVARFSSDDWLNYPVIAADNLIIVTDGNDNSFLVTDSNNTVWAISQHGCRDLNADETINYIDLALLAADWLECTDTNWPCNYKGQQDYLASDIDRDRYVRLGDLAAMVARWSDDVKWLKHGPASNPNPPDGATDAWPSNLSWTPGPYAAEHDVYFGTGNPPPFICTQTAATFAPEPMEYLTTYFWRIDEVSTTGKTTGDPWTFTTRKRRCFPGNTPVWIEGALVPISKVVSGQRVGRPEGTATALYLPDSTNRQVVERVVEHAETPLACYDIVLETENVITVVDTHYFLTDSERWLAVQELRAGMKLKSLKGPIGIRRVEKRQRPFTDKIYNLNIKDSDRYFVGEDGIVVRDW